MRGLSLLAAQIVILAGLCTPARAEDAGLPMMGLVALAKARLGNLAADLASASGDYTQIQRAAAGMLVTGDGVRAATYAMILIIIGCGVEWFYWTYAIGPLRALYAVRISSPREALRFALRRLALVGSGIGLFGAATIGASLAFAWPPGLDAAIVGLTLFVVLLRGALLLIDIVLAPRRSEYRLVPLSDREATRYAWLMSVLAALIATKLFVPAMAELYGRPSHLAEALRFVFGTLIALALFSAFCLPMVLGEDRAPRGSRLPRIPPSFFGAVAVVSAYLVWLFQGDEAGLLLAVALLVLAAQFVLRDCVFFYWRDEIAEPSRDMTGLMADPTLVPTIVLLGLRLVTVLAGLAAALAVMGASMTGFASENDPVARFVLRVLGVVALGFVTNIVWLAIKSTIDHRLKAIGSHQAHPESNPNARLLTLLPLLRVTAAITLGGMFVLSSLWGLGIEITPLLAGAGVLGIALGFGAQALVRDVIAGIFLLVEDVFRVGEYIESGTSTKGTVERITLRTVALRHHNGPLHFVPYGSLGTVRNNSRDWVIEKFNLPLKIDVDSEKIRKMIKKVGEAMLSDPEIGPLMLSPLKGKLYRIDPGIKIFRCNFQTTPGNQYDVRAQAYKRIEAAMREMGITFADGAQTFVMTQADVNPASERLPTTLAHTAAAAQGAPARA